MNNFVPRSRFLVHQKIQWFPGHMRKGIKDIGKTLKSVDCVLEVHDARIPFSGRNLNFISRIASVKPIILLLNKSDLIDQSRNEEVTRKIQARMALRNVQMNDVFFMDSITGKWSTSGYNSQLIESIVSAVEKNKDANSNRSLFSNDSSLNLLVLGIPNVGKSTIINRFRNIFLRKSGKATITGATAGVTRSVLEKIKIAEHPRRMYLFDTPGILEPSFHKLENDRDLESLMRCAVCGNISDEVVGPELIVDYMLYWWNKRADYTYLEYFGAPHPTNDIIELLSYGAVKNGLLKSVRCHDTGEVRRLPDFDLMSRKFLRDFRKGHFGAILLDDDDDDDDRYGDHMGAGGQF